MWEPFTNAGRRAIITAQEVAQRYGCKFIDHNHIFIGLADTQTISDLLKSFGLGPSEVAAASERVFGQKGSSGAGEMVFTPQAKRVIELAFVNARDLDTRYIDAEHLMLGYLSLPESEKIMIGELGLDEGKLRQRLIESLRERQNAPPAAQPTKTGTVDFPQMYDRISQFARPSSGTDLWTGLRFAAEQSDPAAVLIYALSIASHEGSSAEEILRRLDLRLQELSGD